MTKPVPRSRLNITYRTRIEGRPVKQKLPFRLLVLGDFTDGNRSKLEERDIHSILPGMRVDNFMNELEVSVPITDPELATRLVGTLEGKVTGTIKKELEDGKKALVKLSGTAEVSGQRSQNGLGSFRGEVTLSAEVEVPLKDEKITIDRPTLKAVGKVEGDITGSVNTEFACEFAKGPIDVDAIESPISATVPVALTIPLRSLQSFTPEFVAISVPEIRRLMLLRRLLLELRATVSNQSELRQGLKGVLGNAELGELREWLIQSYPQLLIEPRPAKAAGTQPPGGSGQGTPVTPAPPPKPSAPAEPPAKA